MTTSGPRSAGSGLTIAGAGSTWFNADRIVSSNNSYSTTTLNNETSELLAATNFGFAIPSTATINGITVEIEAKESGSGGRLRDLFATKDGTTAAGADQLSSQAITNSDLYYTVGGPASLLGTTWTAAQINASTFGVLLRADQPGSTTTVVSVDHIRITITYTGSPVVEVASLSGTSTSTGALTQVVLKGVSGASTSTGTIGKLASLVGLSGSSGSSGGLSTLADVGGEFSLFLTGLSTSVGTLVKKVIKAFTGESTSAGALATSAPSTATEITEIVFVQPTLGIVSVQPFVWFTGNQPVLEAAVVQPELVAVVSQDDLEVVFP
jgi:hypothetical protein